MHACLLAYALNYRQIDRMVIKTQIKKGMCYKCMFWNVQTSLAVVYLTTVSFLFVKHVVWRPRVNGGQYLSHDALKNSPH